MIALRNVIVARAMDRLFTLQFANACIPMLRTVFTQVRTHLESAQRLAAELGALGHPASAEKLEIDTKASIDVQRRQSELRETMKQITALIEPITELGVEVKAIDGLVDFKSQLGDRVVHLCWKFGEESISHWHELESGFDGRQPVAEPTAFEGSLLH